jgi:hypothetical protein
LQFTQAKVEMKILIQNTESIRTFEDSSSPMNKLGNLWCTLMHDSMGWPIHGHYTCLACGRQHLVSWDREEVALNADLQARAEHLNSASAVPDKSKTEFARVQ